MKITANLENKTFHGSTINITFIQTSHFRTEYPQGRLGFKRFPDQKLKQIYLITNSK